MLCLTIAQPEKKTELQPATELIMKTFDMDYCKYDTSDLRRFVKRRNIDLALEPMAGRRWTTPEDCIVALEEADRNFGIIFLKLSAEDLCALAQQRWAVYCSS